MFDRASLENAITARIGDEAISSGPLELLIAYALHLSAQKRRVSRTRFTSTRFSRKVLVSPASRYR